jgi:hypothetical protein
MLTVEVVMFCGFFLLFTFPNAFCFSDFSFIPGTANPQGDIYKSNQNFNFYLGKRSLPLSSNQILIKGFFKETGFVNRLRRTICDGWLKTSNYLRRRNS